MDRKYEDVFEDWEVAVAKNLIDDFRQMQPCLRREGFEDLLQECLTRWFFVRNDYDPVREASPQTFMGRVVRNKLTDIIREQRADKRKVNHLTVSLDEPSGDNDDSCALEDTIADKNPEFCVQVDLKIDLPTVLDKLTLKQKELCHLLGEAGLNIKQVSDHLGTPRSTIYDEIERIRKIFQKEGLQKYLE